MASTAVYNNGRDDFRFTVSAKLVKEAAVPPKKDAEWKDGADQWAITLTEETYGNSVTLDYWTGVGNRKWARKRGYGGEGMYPVEPDAKSVLYSFGSDLSTALDMPADDAGAMDYLADEFGHEGKPSDLLRQVQALREQQNRARRLLANTGILPTEFAEWAYSLDS